ncbi:MAG: hypothetical protein ABL996_19760, partial [Micropepsaceae bacterium]
WSDRVPYGLRLRITELGPLFSDIPDERNLVAWHHQHDVGQLFFILGTSVMNSNIESSATQLGRIRAGLIGISGSRKTGAQIRAFIDAVCPDFDLRAVAGVPSGPGALAKLINTHFSDIVHLIDRSRGDPLYEIGALGVSVGNLATTTNIWVAFANPRLGQQLIYDRSNDKFFLRPSGALLSEHQFAISPIAPQEFRKIAEDFAISTPENIRAELQPLLEQESFSYQTWISALKAKYPAHFHQWGLFRVQAIINLFRNRLVGANVPPEKLEAIVNGLIADQASAYRERVASRTRQSVIGGSPIGTPISGAQLSGATMSQMALVATIGKSDEFVARDLATLVISNMSLDEIRRIVVPLGAIIDSGLMPKK